MVNNKRKTRRGGAINVPASPPPLSKVNTYTSWPGGVDPTAKLYNQSAMLGGYQRGGESPELKAFKASVKMLARSFPKDADTLYGIIYRNLYEHQSMGGPEYMKLNDVPANDRNKLSKEAAVALDYNLQMCARLYGEEVQEAIDAFSAAFPKQNKADQSGTGGTRRRRSTRRSRSRHSSK